MHIIKRTEDKHEEGVYMNVKEDFNKSVQGVMLVGLDYGKGENSITVMQEDLINFTTIITNTGGIAFSSGIYSQVLPHDLELQAMSMTINGNTPASPVDLSSLKLPAIEVGEVIKVRFNAKVKGEALGIFKTKADLLYFTGKDSFKVNSTEVTLVVLPLNPEFQVDMEMARNEGDFGETIIQGGDILRFRVTIKNKGDTEFMKGFLTCSLSEHLTFLPETFLIDGLPPSVVPYELTEVKLPNLKKEEVVITFQSIVSAPLPEAVRVNSTVVYSYVGKKSPKEIKSLDMCLFPLAKETFIIRESVSFIGRRPTTVIFARVGDIVHFQVIITNTGDINFGEGGFVNFLPEGLYLDPNSITINGRVPNPPVNLNHLLMTPLEVDSILIINFSVKVMTKGVFKNYSRAFMKYRYGSIYNESNEITINVL